MIKMDNILIEKHHKKVNKILTKYNVVTATLQIYRLNSPIICHFFKVKFRGKKSISFD